MNRLALLLGLLLAQPAGPRAHAADAALPADHVRLRDSSLSMALPYASELVEALSTRDWDAAVRGLAAVPDARVPASLAADHAFVRAWALHHAGRSPDAVPLLPRARQATLAPQTSVRLLEGEVLLATQRHDEAARVLDGVPADGPLGVRAALARARAFQGAGRTEEALRVYRALAARPDPAPGSSAAVSALVRAAPPGSSEQRALQARLYRSYPDTPEERAGTAGFVPSPDDRAARGDTLQERGAHDSAVSLLDPMLATAPPDACVLRFAWGRAQFKRNNITAAAAVLEPLGTACRGRDEDRAAKALYLAGKAYERLKRWSDAARAYRRIPELYPRHSMADDGYALGGIALQEAGELSAARQAWARGYEAYPEGDLAAENAWRLAWGAALAGDTEEAIRWADRARQELVLARNPTDVLASRYWSGRWRAWPSVDATRRVHPDAARVAEGARLLEQVAREAPWHWYGLLAAQRLRELDPGRAAALARPVMDPPDAPWVVRSRWLEDPTVKDALALVRLGLRGDALGLLESQDSGPLEPSEYAIVRRVETEAGRFLLSHDRLRTWLKTQSPETLGPNAWKILRQAYPERYWEDVRAVTPYAWDPRVFLALVREESNFNPKIESHVGARGLSQLMPATAARTAKRLGMPWRPAQVWDPRTNLKLGASYLDLLHARYKGNSALALAGYNAGEGNADRWLAAAPNVPLDVYVERIPFRETRHYVKRVSSTWQTYRLLYEQGPPYADLSRYTFDAVPD